MAFDHAGIPAERHESQAFVLFAAVFPQFINPARPAALQFFVLRPVCLLAQCVSTKVYAARRARSVASYVPVEAWPA